MYRWDVRNYLRTASWNRLSNHERFMKAVAGVAVALTVAVAVAVVVGAVFVC